MRLDAAMRGKLFLVFGAVAMMAGMSVQAQDSSAVEYVVLSKTQVMINVDCRADAGSQGCSAVMLTNAQSVNGVQGTAQPIAGHSNWTLVTFREGEFQLASKQTYSLLISHTGANATALLSIDTSPTVQLLPGAGDHSANLFSNVALTLPGSPIPLENVARGDDCPIGKPVHVALSIQFAEILFDSSETALCGFDVHELSAANPISISAIPGRLQPSVKGDTSPKPIEIDSFSNVLGDTLQIDGNTSLGKSKAPANKDAAWLWIDGTITAGTGTAPAWVLDGKLAPLQVQLKRATMVTWFSATANIGNNKVNGHSAKDEIDFSGPSGKMYRDGKTIGEEFSLSPTYETNMALNHRNMLAIGDIVWDWGKLNQTQFVRTAMKIQVPKKMPKEGDYKGGYDVYGWNLHFHTGFEAGGALDSSTVTNSTTKATVGTIPTYSIARFVPEIDGIFQYRWLSFESDLTGRYLFTTEHTAVDDRDGNPYLESVSGWKAVNAMTFSVKPSEQHFAFSVGYMNGFSAPTYQRANGVTIGVQVKY